MSESLSFLFSFRNRPHKRYNRRLNPSNVHINGEVDRGCLSVYRLLTARMPKKCRLWNSTWEMRVASMAQLYDCVRVQNENCSSALTFRVNEKEVSTIARWSESIFTVWRSPIVTVLFLSVSRFEMRSTQGHAARCHRAAPNKTVRFHGHFIRKSICSRLMKSFFPAFSSTVSFYSLFVRFSGRWIQSNWAKTAKVLDFA